MNLYFKQTCQACPQQYDVLDLDDNDKTVGYIRLRWGHLRCQVPDVGGKTIYSHDFDDGLQGIFDTDEQEDLHLANIRLALEDHYGLWCLEPRLPPLRPKP